MNTAVLVIAMVGAAFFTAVVFWMAHTKEKPLIRQYWIVKFKTQDHPDDITFSIYSHQDPNQEASDAIERYCENTGYQITEITEMNQISHDEFINIRKRLYSKLNNLEV